ncbi:hypothetical protein Gpo141_00011930 [Globisporangium polare]
MNLRARMAGLKLEQRGDLLSLSPALEIPAPTLQRYEKNKLLRVHTVTLKTTPSDDQMTEHIKSISSLVTRNLH